MRAAAAMAQPGTWPSIRTGIPAGVAPTTYTQGSGVTFNDTNSGHYNVTLNTAVSPSSVVVNNSSGNYVISGTGSIAGTGSLTKMGSSMLTLSTVNTYTGGTNVSAGTLLVGVNGALPDAPVSVSGAGILRLNTNTGLAMITSLSITGSGKFDVNNNHVFITYGATDPIASIAAYIASGYAGGYWTGPGIVSTAARETISPAMALATPTPLTPAIPPACCRGKLKSSTPCSATPTSTAK